MKNIYEVNYMNDNNIDERIKNICLQAENNYILNYAKSSSPNNNFDKMNNNLPDDISPLDKTLTNSNVQNDIKYRYENNQNNEIIINNINNRLNIENRNRKNKIIKNKVMNSRRNNTVRNNLYNNMSQEMVNSMNNKIKYRSENIISPNNLNINYNNQEEDIVNYSNLIISQSEIKKK